MMKNSVEDANFGEPNVSPGPTPSPNIFKNLTEEGDKTELKPKPKPLGKPPLSGGINKAAML